MAPEALAFNHEYTKKVDIWSIGIIMYEVLTGGKHPLYVSGEDNIQSYKEKLMKISKFSASEEFSKIAESLFHQMTMFSAR